MASISQLMPAGSIASSGFAQRLSVSHGLLPIRIEYPAPEDGFYRRLVVYDNAPSAPGATAEAVVEYTGTPGNLSFNIFPVDATGALLLRFRTRATRRRASRSATSRWSCAGMSTSPCRATSCSSSCPARCSRGQ